MDEGVDVEQTGPGRRKCVCTRDLVDFEFPTGAGSRVEVGQLGGQPFANIILVFAQLGGLKTYRLCGVYLKLGIHVVGDNNVRLLTQPSTLNEPLRNSLEYAVDEGGHRQVPRLKEDRVQALGMVCRDDVVPIPGVKCTGPV